MRERQAEEDISMNKQGWIQVIFQTIALIGGALIYSMSIEHRMTVNEETVKAQSVIIQQMQDTQKLLIDQMRQTDQSLSRLITLEDFIHGMSPDEAEGYYKAKMKAKKVQ